MPDFRPAPPGSTGRILLVVLVALCLPLSLLPLFLLAGPRTMAYHLEGEELTVEARLGPLDLGRTIPRDRVTASTAVTITSAHRQAGTAVDGFCHGRWSAEPVGVVWMATSCTNDVVKLDVDGHDHPWLLSPLDREAFLAALPAGDGTFEVLPAPPGSPALAITGLLVGLLIAGTGALLVISPQRLRYELLPGALRVHTAWGTRVVSLVGAGIRPEPGVRIGIRLFGIGMPGHNVGRFRVGGRTAQLYLSDPAKAVWIEPTEGLPVLLSPEDLDGFLTAARDAQRG